MLLQKQMCQVARPAGFGFMAAQVFLILLGISTGWIAWVLVVCGLAIMVIGHIGMKECQTYAIARYDEIRSKAAARSPNGSKALFLTENELTEVVELLGYNIPRTKERKPNG